MAQVILVLFQGSLIGLNIKTKRICKPKDFSEVDKIILPGVGSFDFVVNKLVPSGMITN